jgi:DNA repair protein RadA/Sms
MAKTKTVYVCNNCGEESITWQGKCPTCGQWNTFQEFKLDTGRRGGSSASIVSVELKPLALTTKGKQDRHTTGSAEFDRVLGGGIIPGSVILLGGEPGIGKSTLLLQVAQNSTATGKVIYFSGEESEYQVGDRAKRLGLAPTFLFSNQTHLGEIKAAITKEQPSLVIVDSIQTLYDDQLPSTPGSLVQVRESALQLQEVAKQQGVSIILVGHITKEGTVAGPKTLEHMVDVVLYLEGEARSETRILRSMKNRFGATHEIGLFALEEQGMHDVSDSTSLFIEEHETDVPGTTLTAVLEGVRPILVEVQALVVPTVFGYPKRTSLGIDIQRLHILLAILERNNCSLAQHDVFVNVVGGYKITDRRADLALCMALLSAASGVALPAKQVFYGEVGLTGEIRSMRQADRIKKEVERLGYIAQPPGRSLHQMAQQFNVLKTRKQYDHSKSE